MPRSLSLMLLLLASCATCQTDAAAPSATVVYVVRHAEKARDQGDDPELTGLGRARAQALARVLDGVELDAVYASQYRRTAQTVQPAADARSMEVRIVPAGDTDRVLEPIASTHRGKRVLIAGHWNTVPQIIHALGVPEPVTIGHEDHGNLFIVTITDGSATLERRRFDP